MRGNIHQPPGRMKMRLSPSVLHVHCEHRPLSPGRAEESMPQSVKPTVHPHRAGCRQAFCRQASPLLAGGSHCLEFCNCSDAAEQHKSMPRADCTSRHAHSMSCVERHAQAGASQGPSRRPTRWVAARPGAFARGGACILQHRRRAPTRFYPKGVRGSPSRRTGS